MFYPAEGQGNEQLSKNRQDYHLWAVHLSGSDPSNAQFTSLINNLGIKAKFPVAVDVGRWGSEIVKVL